MNKELVNELDSVPDGSEDNLFNAVWHMKVLAIIYGLLALAYIVMRIVLK